MTANNLQDVNCSDSELGQESSNEKSYEKPVLISYGDVRDVTLGPTIGGGESGCTAVFRGPGPPPGPCPGP